MDEGDKDEKTLSGTNVRISIREQLQSFRRFAPDSKNAGVNKAPPKRQNVIVKQPEPPHVCHDVELAKSDTTPKDNTDSILPETPLNLTGGERNTMETEEENHEIDETTTQDSQMSSGSTNQRENVIRPIDRGVVHQICSGQVIVTLSTAVKELVENSLDAGAKNIDIRLMEYGSKLIEVYDNGDGIDESNFEGLALKHHTSKISEFEDLTGLTTFGFRGEALSSLCALSKLTVTTRHKSSKQKIATKIEYDYSGRITSRTTCARESGTTVMLRDLFHTLPVRHREFMKNLKREFHRLVNILYGYCLVVTGSRISCTNEVGNSGPKKVIGVPSYNSMKERIVALFGSKQFSTLLEIKQCDILPEEILSEFGLTDDIYEKIYQIEGYISMPNHGRSSNDRQFFFINSRPCDPVKISRVINEVYHGFSRHQNPFVCLHIKTRREDVDVNVTPDKRTLYVQNEKILLATLKASLIPLLTAAASSYNPINSQVSSQLKLNFDSQAYSQPEPDLEVDELDEDSMCSSSSLFRSQSQSQSNSQNSFLSNSQEDGFSKQYSSQTGNRPPSSVVARTQSFLNSLRNKRPRDNEVVSRSHEDHSKLPKLTKYLQKYEVPSKQSIRAKTIVDDDDSGENEIVCLEEGVDQEVFSSCMVPTRVHQSGSTINSRQAEDEMEILYDDDYSAQDDVSDEAPLTRKTVTVSVNWQELSAKLTSMKMKNEAGPSTKSYARRFRAKIAPEDNTTAEEELQKQLTQDMFYKMEIVGQFNLGFIIVKNGPDLFLVDQHASDEKFNFEDLQKTTVLQGQLLIHPLDLELPAISENIIMDNIEVFQKNGFDFIISPDEEVTRRVKLSKIPYSKRTEFGKADVEELVFMMEDASEKSFYRPTKVRDMLASRACRKSVMIGTALSPKEMRVILDHMGEMVQPWNCPHGRPTIRHLINLNLLPDMDYTKFTH